MSPTCNLILEGKAVRKEEATPGEGSVERLMIVDLNFKDNLIYRTSMITTFEAILMPLSKRRTSFDSNPSLHACMHIKSELRLILIYMDLLLILI